MGIDVHGLRTLQYAARRAELGNVATMGRQSVHIEPDALQRLLPGTAGRAYGPHCEALLVEQLGARSVTSFDASAYEGADVIHDMNRPLAHGRTFDTVVDLGTLEHIFDVAVALRNIAGLCRVGGQIVHALPANNYNGHGFWQFSPELFFSLYSAANGFGETEVYIASLDDEAHWWRAAVPAGGVRVEYTSASRSYVIAFTRKLAAETGQNVQQSDYLANWQGEVAAPLAVQPPLRRAARKVLRRLPYLWRHADRVLLDVNTHRDAWMHRLEEGNLHYTRVPLSGLLGGG